MTIKLKIKEVSQDTRLSEENIKNAMQNANIAFKQISCSVRKYLNSVVRIIKSANEEMITNMYIAMNTDDKTLNHLFYMRNRVKTKRLYKKYDKKIKEYVRNKRSL